MNNLLKLTLLAALPLKGCATIDRQYSPPAEQKIQNTEMIDKPFDSVWDRLVRNLSSDFFVINNIDKNSRLINVSFSTPKPTDFVDCGTTTQLLDVMGEKSTYVYNSAESSVYKTPTPDKMHMMDVDRKASLTGIANIYVAPNDQKTEVVVNSKYVLIVASTPRLSNPGMAMSTSVMTGPHLHRNESTVSFSTKQGHVSPEITCYSKGVVEQKILSFAN